MEGVLRGNFRNLLPPIGSGDRTEGGQAFFIQMILCQCQVGGKHSKSRYGSRRMLHVEAPHILWKTSPQHHRCSRLIPPRFGPLRMPEDEFDSSLLGWEKKMATRGRSADHRPPKKSYVLFGLVSRRSPQLARAQLKSSLI